MNTTKCPHGMYSPEACSHCSTPQRIIQKAGVKRRARHPVLPRSEAITFEYGSAGTLTVNADMAKRWKKGKKVWCFHERRTADAINGHTLILRVSVYTFDDLARGNEWPVPDWSIWHEPPRIENSGVTFETYGTVCRFSLVLFEGDHFNPHLNWRERKGWPAVHWPVFLQNLACTFDSDGMGMQIGPPYYRIAFDMQVLPPERAPAPEYFEWQRRFFIGGLPSLGKGSR